MAGRLVGAGVVSFGVAADAEFFVVMPTSPIGVGQRVCGHGLSPKRRGCSASRSASLRCLSWALVYAAGPCSRHGPGLPLWDPTADAVHTVARVALAYLTPAVDLLADG